MPNKINNKVELLAPAGNFEKLEIAMHYGADAVYLAGKNFSLRNLSENFSNDELKKAIAFAHKNNVKVYVTLNIFPKNFEIDEISQFLSFLSKIEPDAVIISDPGILMQAKKLAPNIKIHLSTQANTTNYQSVLFWESFGVKRINVARELALTEIKEISDKTKVEVEAFVHGAMCMSYSGRCLLSNFLNMRDSNRGMCSQPCRWKYFLMEELRPDSYYPVIEDNRGMYIFNSKDLCMIEHIPELIDSGICSLKIEGRMKSIYYLASTVKTYRQAIDSYYSDPKNYKLQDVWIEELNKNSNRGYSTGFYFNDPDQITASTTRSISSSDYQFLGKIIEQIQPNKYKLDVKNQIRIGNVVEIINNKDEIKNTIISNIFDDQDNQTTVAHPGSIAYIVIDSTCFENDLIRKKN